MPNPPPHRSRGLVLLLTAAVSWCFGAGTWAQDLSGKEGDGPPPAVRLEAVPQRSEVRPGDQIAVAVILDHQEGFHTWPVQDVLPPGVRAAVADNVTKIVVEPKPAWVGGIGLVQWPEPHPARVMDPESGDAIEVPTYGGRAVAYIPVMVSTSAPPGPAEMTVRVFYQACDDSTCQMPEWHEVTSRFTILAAGARPSAAPADTALFSGFDMGGFATLGASTKIAEFQVFGRRFTIDTRGVGLVLLLAVALLGGFILNLTPCVLPVIPIKILGLSQAAANPARCFLLGVWMSVGVICFWLAIGAAISFVAGFDSINNLFQYPGFLVGVGGFIIVMAIGMLGFFDVRLPNFVYAINPSHETAHGSVLFGIMTAVLSTPCTAPFMGSAAAFAATQHPAITMLTFAAIGLGMALPYLVLSANPRWVSRVPRTGPASVLVKQVMGLLMLAVAAYFLGIGLAVMLTEAPDPPTRVYWWAVAVFVIVAGGWLAYRTTRLTRRPGPRLAFGVIGLLMGSASILMAREFSDKGPINWVYYTPQRLDAALRSGKIVVVDLTADWCLNCKALESAVLHRREIAAILNGPGVVPIKVDFTSKNPDGSAYQKSLSWVGIPLLVIYGPGLGGERLMYDSYTPEVVRTALERAAGGTVLGQSGPNAEPAAASGR
ncbi:MAG TPA: cytochrome c biogenesis protein CcdA [Phycisphaerales bacterium]|nr:cytochrome c biogenesis protein CcdA [Phycisphaerales bacterium]